MIVVDTLIRLASSSRRLVLFGIFAAVGNNGSGPDMLELGVLLAAWQLLALMTPVQRYFNSLKSRHTKRKQAVIDSKVKDMFAFSRRKSDNHWKIDNSVRELIGASNTFMTTTSMALAEILNAWVAANRIGWRALVPIAVAFGHWLLTRMVTNKIEQLREQNRHKEPPNFRNNVAALLRHIRTVKFYAWEDLFNNESITKVWLTGYQPPVVWRIIQGALNNFSHAAAEVSSVLAISSYINAVGTITYTDISLLRSSICSLTNSTGTAIKLTEKLALFRVEKAILQEFFDADSDEYIERVPVAGDLTVDLSECVFMWSTKGGYSLAPITLQIKAGQFVTVVGRVGSGKSSFLSAICGEMPIVGGQGRVYGRIGYVEQKPWIMNATFRENVIMGADFDESFFWQVVDACALSTDVQLFPNSDLTMIGTNGVNLSGGQKVRLALAR
ncbi:hypothetical protein IWW38_002103 [Coemansia aciculifera]|uniref:Uncharacterized protein n=1 Tax=Coemansia aciculifera TaxID=417176 RepID=A0ACC1M445_9FUNG|nr:hypothetical protein IWW38_002103 [Coemansia aciculifera]